MSVAAALAAGCAAHPSASSRPATLTLDRAELPLEAIGPAAAVADHPTTRPEGRAPVEALIAYAAGRDDLARNDARAAAVDFRRAADIDPDQFDVQYDLGRSLVMSNGPEAGAVAALSKAVDLRPDRIDVRTELARLYLSASQYDAAIAQLRTAMRTGEYASDPGRAAVVDLLLARALAADGYDRAALDRYGVLLTRFKDPSLPVRDNPDLMALTDRPDGLFEPIGRLYDKHGEWATALQAYVAATSSGGADQFDLQRAMAMDRARLGHAGDAGQADAALRQAADVVAHDGASPPSLQLLADVCQTLGRAGGQVEALRRLSAHRPDDRSVLFAYADALAASGQPTVAADVMDRAWSRLGRDVRVARRLVDVQRHQGNPTAAARVVIATSAAHPDTTDLLSRGWDALVRPWKPDRFTPAAVAALGVPADQEPARQFWLARTLAQGGRSADVAAALDRSVGATPPFAPAVRARVALILATAATPDVEPLAKRLPAGLGAEVRGRTLLAASHPAEAANALADAIRLGDAAPDVAFAKAQADHAAHAPTGRDADFERALSQLALRWPLDEDAYVALFGYYVDPAVGDVDHGLQAITAWRASDPDSVPARLLQARTDHQLGNGDAADRAIDQLLATDADDPDVLTAAASVYDDRRDLLTAKLEAVLRAHPTDTDAVVMLVGTYVRGGHRADAVRLLDQARAAVATDADLLYRVSGIYAEIGQRTTAEEVLAQVLQVEPSHPGASNDLGFSWADAGRKLDQAEQMIRTAVAAEPDNRAFLDSLGWVLYKRGKFAEARPLLERAVGPATSAGDPAVLDHLGDTLYRLDRRTDAQQTWQRALSALGSTGDDQPTLRLQLQQKIKQVAGSRSVDVAPLAIARG